jgi:protein-tyrosine phosphatase
MAEAVFRHKVKEAGLEDRIQVDSAGTGDWHVGQPPHAGTRKLLDTKRIPWNGIAARQVTKEDLRKFDYVVAMDNSNLRNLRALAGGLAGSETKLCLLTDFVPDARVADVPDPYYTGNFEEVYELVNAGCEALLARIKAELDG